MLLARVVGTIVATIKDESLRGQKLMLVRLLNRHGQLLPRTLVALDAVGAGVGETVYCCRGKESSFAWLPRTVITDFTIIGIADPGSNPQFLPSPEAS